MVDWTTNLPTSIIANKMFRVVHNVCACTWLLHGSNACFSPWAEFLVPAFVRLFVMTGSEKDLQLCGTIFGVISYGFFFENYHPTGSFPLKSCFLLSWTFCHSVFAILSITDFQFTLIMSILINVTTAQLCCQVAHTPESSTIALHSVEVD